MQLEILTLLSGKRQKKEHCFPICHYQFSPLQKTSHYSYLFNLYNEHIYQINIQRFKLSVFKNHFKLIVSLVYASFQPSTTLLLSLSTWILVEDYGQFYSSDSFISSYKSASSFSILARIVCFFKSFLEIICSEENLLQVLVLLKTLLLRFKELLNRHFWLLSSFTVFPKQFFAPNGFLGVLLKQFMLRFDVYSFPFRTIFGVYEIEAVEKFGIKVFFGFRIVLGL